MPLRRTSGHTFSSPANRVQRSFDIQHTDNPMLHDGMSASPSFSSPSPARQDSTLGEQKVVSSIVARLVNKLPCNSGTRLAMMEIDDVVNTSVESLLSISRIRLPLVVQALASSLEAHSKYTAAIPLTEAPLDTLHSQLFLLNVLLRCLSESWRLNSEAAQPSLSELPTCWPDPPALDDHLARHLLSVLVIYIRMVSQDTTGGSGVATPVPSRDGGKAPGAMPVVMGWGRQPNPSASAFSLGAKFIQRHSYAGMQTKAPAAERVEGLAASASTISTAIEQMTKQTARIVFILSASNWPLVMSRIKARAAHLNTTLEEYPELYELRLLAWANIDTSRLAQVLQEIMAPFLHAKRPAQPALATALRKAIWNWIEVNPAEFQSVIEGSRKLDGTPDMIFDVLQTMSDSSSTTKRAKVYYPLMVMLLVLSPDMMKRIALGESARSGSALAKRLSFMDSLRKGLGQSKSFEACAVCYVDLVRAAMSCSPRLDTSGIRSLVPDFQNELKNALFYSALSTEITDINVLVDGLVALYRANPAGTTSLIFPKLWNDAANESSKIIGVRACTAIVNEGRRLPWHQPASGLRSDVAPAVRSILKAQTPAVVNSGPNRRGRSSMDGSLSGTDLVWEILNLFAVDPNFAFDGIGDPSDTLTQLFVCISSLTAATCPMSIRAQAGKTNLLLLDHLVDSANVDPSRAALVASSTSSIWQILIDASRQLLFDFQIGDVGDMALIAGAFRDTVHTVLRATQSLPEVLGKAPNARPAVLIAKVATVTNLTGPDVEQTNLASPALLALSKLMLIVRSGISNDQNQADEITGHSTMLAELGSLPPATGRHQQQRAIRRIMKRHVRPSTLLSTVWFGLNARATTLTEKVIAAEKANNGAEDRDMRRRNLAADIDGLTEDESKEWQNLVAFLCATSGVGLHDMSLPPTIVEVVGKGVLPRVYEESIDSHGAVETFFRQCVDMTFSPSIHVRESMKDALGSELPLSLSRVLVVQMSKILSHSFGQGGVSASDTFTIFVEQAIAILRLWVDRFGPSDNAGGVQVDLGELLYMIAQYIHRLGREDIIMRMRIKLCQLIEALLNKPDFVVLGNASKLRNALLEWMSEWSIEAFREEQYHSLTQFDKVQRDLDIACLRAMIPVTDGLVIRQPGDESEDPQGVNKSRLFYRYYSMLLRVLERSTSVETESSQVAASVSGMSMRVSGSDNYPALAIQVLSNLLSANVDVGLQHCLALGYHEDSGIRTAFMQLLTNILQQGARFGGLATKDGSSAPKLYLEALTSPNLAFVTAICDITTGADLDEISMLLFRTFEAKGNLLSLMKLLIEREVQQTNHESELFRANSITTRLLTLFAKTYGYNYVRNTLQPLIANLADKPPECSFELDPSKVGPEEDIQRNTEHLRIMTQALLDLIYSSTPNVPILFRALCHHIWEVVEERFPDSRHSAVGSFVFLRFFCPAIVAPEGIDMDVSPDTRDTRRALLLVTKIIQNLANNVLFGNKEAHMKALNPFLSENIRQVTKFLSDVAVRPRSWDVSQATKMFQEEGERNLDADFCNATIHRFVFKHVGRLETSLEAMPPTFRARSSSSTRSLRLDLDGKAALAMLRNIMEESGPPVEITRIAQTARAQIHADFMSHNEGRNTDSVANAFYEGPASQNGRRIFYFIVARVALVDYDLLAYHVLSTIKDMKEVFDLIIDLTDFSSMTEMPSTWLRRSFQMVDSATWTLINTVVLYNPNSYARKRLRRIIGDLLAVAPPAGKSVVAVSSPGELADLIPYTTLALPERTMALAFDAEHVFTNLLCITDHEMQVPVVVKLGSDCIQVATWRKQDLTPTLKAYIIDIIRLKDVDDVVLGSGVSSDRLTIKHSQNQSVTFISRKRIEMAQMIRAARGRLRDTPSEDRALRPSDVPGTLLNVAFLNLSSSDEILRLGAYNLVSELCQFFKYELSSSVMKVSTGLLIPSNSLSFVNKLSKTLATSAPSLTLEFLKEWTIGFAKADIPQKSACLAYVAPWLKNLDQFAKPTRDEGVENIKLVAEIVRSLISLSVTEKNRLGLSIQEHVWSVIGKSHEALVDLVVTELLNTAVNAGPGSEKAETVADILVSLSSTTVRGKVISRLRKAIGQTYIKPSSSLTESASWNEICTLARINLTLAFNPQTQIDNQLFLAELCHSITLLIGIGPVLMRQTVYGLVMNVLQALATHSSTGDMDGTTLQHLLHKLQQQEMIAAFGLTQSQGSLELFGMPQWDQTGVSHLDSLEMVVKFLGDVLTSGAVSTDCANQWRARWMGLVAATCFQSNPATQPQAFTALGYLAADEMDDDLVYQILISLSNTLMHFQESDTVLIVSMLRCLARVIPGLLPDSRYAPTLFWLAVAVLQLAYIPLFAPALELLLTTLRHLDANNHFVNGLFGNLLDVRKAVGESARKLDQLCGINFDTDACFSLVAILYKGVRHPNTRKLTIETLTEFLRLSSHAPREPTDEEPLIGAKSVAFFTSLLPISSANTAELKALFTAAGVDVASHALEDLSSLSVFPLLHIPDNSTALLLITLVVTILGQASSDTEKLVLYRLLAEASQETPEVVAMAYDQLIPRMSAVLNSTSSTAILSSVTQIYERAMVDQTYSFPTGASDAATLHKKSSFAGAPGSNNGPSSPREQVLEELGMKGLTEMSFAGVKLDRLSSMAKWVAALIESLTM